MTSSDVSSPNNTTANTAVSGNLGYDPSRVDDVKKTNEYNDAENKCCEKLYEKITETRVYEGKSVSGQFSAGGYTFKVVYTAHWDRAGQGWNYNVDVYVVTK